MCEHLDELTLEQTSKMDGWVQKWVKIGLSTEPANREQAETAYRVCYRFAGLNSDVPIIWMQSPLAGALAASVSALLVDSSAVYSAVRSAVDTAVRSAVGSAVYSAVYSAVDSAVGSAVYSAVDTAVRSAVRSAVGSNRRLSWHYWLGGALGAAWPAYESFFREVCGLNHGKNSEAAAYAACSEHAGYWWPNKNFIMACDRPQTINLDVTGRLHSETGHSIAWRDGWGLYHWHGHAVPADWIVNRPSLTPAVALSQRNAEDRRAAYEILGWRNILAGLDAKVVQADKDPSIGTLLQVDLPEAPGKRFLRVLCGTGREFAIPVPREMKTARQANAWTFGRDVKTFKPEVRT